MVWIWTWGWYNSFLGTLKYLLVNIVQKLRKIMFCMGSGAWPDLFHNVREWCRSQKRTYKWPVSDWLSIFFTIWKVNLKIVKILLLIKFMFSIIHVEQHKKGNQWESKMLQIYSFEINIIILLYFVYTVAFPKKIIFSYLITVKKTSESVQYWKK